MVPWFLVVQKNLEVGEVLAVDVSSIVAVSGSVNVQIKYNGPMRRVIFGVSIICIIFFQNISVAQILVDVIN